LIIKRSIQGTIIFYVADYFKAKFIWNFHEGLDIIRMPDHPGKEGTA